VKRQQLLDTVANLPACVIGMEACGSAQHCGRAFQQLGHTVKLMHPKYVKPYVKTNKNDGRDAEAICEAVGRPTMRCVSIKTVEQADLQAVHRTRLLFVKHRTAVINQIRGLLAEYGLVMAQPPEKVRPALVRFLDDAASGLTAVARDTFSELSEQLTELDSRIERVTRRIERVYRTHPVCRKLAAVPGIGPLTATVLLATVGQPHAFHNGRHLAAWWGGCLGHMPVEARSAYDWGIGEATVPLLLSATPTCGPCTSASRLFSSSETLTSSDNLSGNCTRPSD